jgi:hypothetical protein
VPIDPRIALGVQPMQIQQPDPNSGMNALARIMQLRGLQDEQKANALTFQEKQRGIANENALNEVYRSAYGADGTLDQNALFSGLAQRGLGAKIPGVQKSLMEAQEAKFKVQNEAAKGYERFQMTIGAHANNPNLTREGVAADVQGLVAAGAMDGSVAQRLLASMPQDPQQLRGYLGQALKSRMTPEQVLSVFAPKPTEVSNGQQKGFRDTNPNSPTYGQPTAGAPVQMQMTPGEAASDQRARTQIAEQKRHNTTMEGFRSSEVGGVEYKQDTNGNWLAFPKKPGAGPIQPRAVEGVPGKKEASARNVLTIINEAEKLIDGATGSYLGAAADETARAFGKSTAGAQATAQLKALEGQLMMAMPRMEGPQSNYDVQLYRQMAGQIGDPTVPRETKKAALAKVKALQQQYAGQPEGAWAAPAAGKGTARISGDAEYNALPSGTEFVGPDGKTRRKP